MTLMEEMGLCEDDCVFYLSWKVIELRLIKKFQTKGWKKTTLNDFWNIWKKQLTQHQTEVWCGIQQTVVDEKINKWRRNHRTCVAVFKIYWKVWLTCPILTFSHWMAKHFMINISCYSVAEVRVFWYSVNACYIVNLSWYHFIKICKQHM